MHANRDRTKPAGWRRTMRQATPHRSAAAEAAPAERRPGGRRAGGNAGGLDTHHETGGFAARLSRDARAERPSATCFGTRGGGGREGTLDSTNRGPQWWAAKGAASPRLVLACQRRERRSDTRTLTRYLTNISCLRLDFVDRLVGKRYMGGSVRRRNAIAVRWRVEPRGDRLHDAQPTWGGREGAEASIFINDDRGAPRDRQLCSLPVTRRSASVPRGGLTGPESGGPRPPRTGIAKAYAPPRSSSCRPSDVLRHAWRWRTRGDTRLHKPRPTMVDREGRRVAVIGTRIPTARETQRHNPLLVPCDHLVPTAGLC